MTQIEFINHIGFKQVELFEQSNYTYMELMVNGISFKNILNTCYRSLVSIGKLIKIESLPVEEKQRLFEIIKEFDEQKKLTKDQYISACCSLYALEFYLKNRL